MFQRLAFRSAICATSVLTLVGAAFAQYDTGFETSDGISASPGGTALTGQDGFFLPSGIDYWAMTYAGNAFGFSQNPQGGSQFAVGQGMASPDFSRAQRVITWPAPRAIMEYDVACQYIGLPGLASNNIGSFSLQPYPGSASALHLFTFANVLDPTSWQAGYLGYDANGVAMVAPGAIPGPEWENLSMNHWYRLETKVDFTTNQITEASITDLTTNITATASLTGVYLEGGAGGGRPVPTAFRIFSGGSLEGNVLAFDNMEFRSGGGGYTCDITGQCPGNITVNWSGAQPSKTQGIVFASNTGSFRLNSGACAGTQLGLGTRNLQLVRTLGTGNGSGSIGRAINSGACGGFVQLVTVASPCETSSVGQIP